MIAGASLLGIVGAIIAIPIVAVALYLAGGAVSEAARTRRRSSAVTRKALHSRLSSNLF